MRGADGVIRSTPKWGDNRLGSTVGVGPLDMCEKKQSQLAMSWSGHVCSKSRLLISYTAETPILTSFGSSSTTRSRSF